jgi:hypothetical protein
MNFKKTCTFPSKTILAAILFSLFLSFSAIAEKTPEFIRNFQNQLSGKSAKIKGNNTGSFSFAVNQEIEYLKIERSLIANWKDHWRHKAFEKFQTISLMDPAEKNWHKVEDVPTRSLDGISEFKWNPYRKQSIREYFSEFSRIEDVDFVTKSYFWKNEDISSGEIKLNIDFDIRGFLADNQRRTDRGSFQAILINQSGEWKVKNISIKAAETLKASRAPSFEDVTKIAGLDKIPVYSRDEAIRRGGYALAISNGSESSGPDIFVGSSKKSSVWKNLGNGKFESLENINIADHTLVKSAVFADFENVGRSDLLLVRFTPKQLDSDVVFYKNIGDGKFEEKKDFVLNRWKSNYAMPLAVADYNNDGKLDFYVGFPGAKDFTNLQKNGLFQEGSMMQGLFMNKGSYIFDDVTKTSGMSFLNNQPTQVFAHSSMAYDIDKDGKQDVLVVDDRGNLSPIYRNLGDGKFEAINQKLGISTHSFGMGVAIASVSNDGNPDVLISYVNFSGSDRLAMKSNRTELNAMGGGGLRFFKNLGNGTFVEKTKEAGLEWAGEGVAGAEFIDYNSDGFQDIIVSNGLWSGTSKNQDIGSEFVIAAASFGGGNLNDLSVHTNSETQSVPMKFLKSFRGSVDQMKYDPKGKSPSMAGYQRKRLYRNNQDGTFTELGFLEGIDFTADGYIVAKGDIDTDGKQDLIFRNADPGTDEVRFPVVQVFRNKNANGNDLFIELKGDAKKGSNADAIGALVKVEVGGRTLTQALVANNGPAQSEKVLHFGLGNYAKAERVEVRFPSGAVQMYKNVPAGKVVLKENETKIGSRVAPEKTVL